MKNKMPFYLFIAISFLYFYLNIVSKNIVCELGLNENFPTLINRNHSVLVKPGEVLDICSLFETTITNNFFTRLLQDNTNIKEPF